jgi:flavin-dependent dehydrogenase
MLIDTEYDVVVVGARVAGSVLAALLGDSDYRVLLVDRTSFPSPTLSTHFFRGAQLVSVLERLGLLEPVLALGAPPLTRQFSYVGGSDQASVEPPQDPGTIGYCLSVRREPLDHLLVRRAVFTGVTLAEGTRVTDLLCEEGRVTGVRLAMPAGEMTVRARIVVGADGRHSTVARLVDAPVEEQHPPYRGLYYRYMRNYASPDGGPPDGPEFSMLEDEVAYVFPSDAGMTCIALSINLDTFAWLRQAVEERFDERFTYHRGLAERVAAATPKGPVFGCGPEPNYVRVPFGPGWALVGDAGLHRDPWSGEGMDAAGVHATYLANAIHQWLSGNSSGAEALRWYHHQRNAHGLERYRQTVALARDLRPLSTP